MVKITLSHSTKQLDVATLKEHAGFYLILDAREQAEFNISHIPGAVYLGFENLDLDGIRSISRDTPIAVYCSIGYRSEKVVEQLEQEGFTQVYNVYGSIFEWANRGYPLVAADGKATRKVHGFDKMWGVWLDDKKVQVVYH